jgi:hypothetical protein
MACASRAGTVAIRSAAAHERRTAWKCDIRTAIRAFTLRLRRTLPIVCP